MTKYNIMSDVWKEVVGSLKPYFENCMEVGDYQREVEFCLRYLGWKRTDGNVRSQLVIPLGGGYSLRPDIYLQKDELQLPVEVKQPNSLNQVENLLSCMNSLKSNVGLFVGKNIQLYYRNHEDENEIVPIMTVEIDESDANGEVLCELLQFNDCSKENIDTFCGEHYEDAVCKLSLNRKLMDFFQKDKIIENIEKLIVDKLMAEGFNYDSVVDELRKFDIIDSLRALNVGLRQELNNQENEFDMAFELYGDRDYSQYSFDGGRYYYGKGRFVLELIRKYVNDNPDVSYYDLEELFPARIINKNRGVVCPYHKMKDRKSYFTKPGEIIVLGDGSKVVVNKQWNKINIENFLLVAEKLYNVKKL